MFPTIAGIAVIAGVCYILGLYSGSYMFPMIASEPSTGLTPEEKKLLRDIYYAVHGITLSDDELFEESKSIDEQFHEQFTPPAQEKMTDKQYVDVVRHLETNPHLDSRAAFRANTEDNNA